MNDIDVSSVTDMINLFNADYKTIFKSFNSDISKWNVSNVENMNAMFSGCKKFDQDLSNWVVNTNEYFDIFDDCPIDKPNYPKFN